MPMITVMAQKQVEQNSKALATLEKKCKNSELRWRKARRQYIFTVHGEERAIAEQDDTMMAVSEYGNNVFAVYPAEYLKREQFIVMFYFIRNIVPEGGCIVVFDRESYNAVMRYSRGRNISVRIA